MEILAGKWEGRWIGANQQIDTVLLVEHLGTSTAAVVYSIGETNYTRGYWARAAATIRPGVIQFSLPNDVEVEYVLQANGTLKATIVVKGTRSYATMAKFGS